MRPSEGFVNYDNSTSAFRDGDPVLGHEWAIPTGARYWVKGNRLPRVYGNVNAPLREYGEEIALLCDASVGNCTNRRVGASAVNGRKGGANQALETLGKAGACAGEIERDHHHAVVPSRGHSVGEGSCAFRDERLEGRQRHFRV